MDSVSYVMSPTLICLNLSNYIHHGCLFNGTIGYDAYRTEVTCSYTTINKCLNNAFFPIYIGYIC